MAEPPVILQASAITRAFTNGREVSTVLDSIDLGVREGELVALVGPSGSGKSTLLHILGLLDEPTSGEVHLAGEATSQASRARKAQLRNERLGYVFQAYNLLGSLTALENVCLPAVLAGQRRQDYVPRARRLLDQVELADLASRYPAEMSGGQQQRVGIARALVMDPDVVLADEPTGNLDSKSSALVMELLRSLNADGRTLVIVTHDAGIAEHAARVVSLRDGRIEADSGSRTGAAAGSRWKAS